METDNNTSYRLDEGPTQRIDRHTIRELVCGALPASVLQRTPEITVHEDDLLIVLSLEETLLEGPGGEIPEVRAHAEQQLIRRLRQETRESRVRLSRALERSHGLTISWGMRVGGTVQLFTNNTKPVMTRLSARERQVLDTLVAANIARTRSAALSYLVRLFATDYQEWLLEAQESLAQIDALRERLQPHPRSGPPLSDHIHQLSGEDELEADT